MAPRRRSILLYGRTGSGKSSQIGELTEHVKRTYNKHTRLYTSDRGGTDPIRPHADLGLVEIVERGTTDPFVFWNKAVRGYVRDAQGKWVPGKNDNIGLFAFEGLTPFGDDIMAAMIKKAAEGVSIGGGANISFAATGDGESVKISGSNMAMYGVAQARITEEVWESFRLPGEYILWTASVSKEEDPNATGKVLGPAVVGKALTTEVPRWFNLSFRIDVLPATQAKPKRHTLYLGNSTDVNAGNVASLGNTRVPLGGPEVPNQIEPASIVKAILLIDEATAKATEAIKQRLGSK